VKSNQYMLIGIGGLVAIALLFGGLDIFYSFLDLL